MIDTHCHVIFGVDDGATTIEDSIDMIETAISNGITKILCTPHSIPGHLFERNDDKFLRPNFEFLVEAVMCRNLAIELYLGSEFQLCDASIPWIDEHKIVTLNNTNRILAELPWHYGGKKTYSEDFYLKRLLDEGYKVIIAHPERYESVLNDFATLKRWREMGCDFQVNRTSLINGETHEKYQLAWRMVEEGYCDVVASDAHYAHGVRVNNIQDAYDEIAIKFGNEVAERLCVLNPERLITGEELIKRP